MKRGLKMPVGMALIAVLAIAGLMGLFTLTAAQPAEAQSTNANLGSLSVMDGDKTVTLSPTFSPGHFSYTGSVPNSTTSVEVTATAANVNAVVDGGGPWPLTGDGPFFREITVYAEAANVDLTYSIRIDKLPQNSDATLDTLEVTDDSSPAKTVTITPTFDAGTTSYTAEVANSVEMVTLKATSNDENATISLPTTADPSGTTGASGVADDTDTSDNGLLSIVTLATTTAAATTTTISVMVTAEDGTSTDTYVLRVKQNAQSDVADLDSLRITPGTSRRPIVLTPRFDAEITSYTAEVANNVGKVTLTAMAIENAVLADTVAVSGGDDDDNSPVAATVAEEPAAVRGDNKWTGDVTLVAPVTSATFTTINITVTAEDTSTQEMYTVVIEREAPGSDATLKVLTLTDNDDESVTPTPMFEAGTASYTAEVANVVTTVTVEATANDENATISAVAVNTPAAVGEVEDPATDDYSGDVTLPATTAANTFTTLTITVTAQNSSTGVYTVVIERVAQSTDKTLRSLSVSPGAETLSPAFDKDTENYTAEVPYSVTEVAVMPTPSNKYAMVDVDGEENGMVPLQVGVNRIDITVTPDTTVEEPDLGEYTLRVTRLLESSDASLSALDLWLYPMPTPMMEIGDLTSTFMADDMDYEVMAENSVAQIKVNAVTNHDGARAMVTAMMGTNTVRVDSANVLDLAVGDTEITVRVTAEDGTVMTYMITVTRPAMTEVTRTEVLTAIRAYLAQAANAPTRAEVVALIRTYLAQ